MAVKLNWLVTAAGGNHKRRPLDRIERKNRIAQGRVELAAARQLVDSRVRLADHRSPYKVGVLGRALNVAVNLPLVIDNPRFLIVPWITIPNLGSYILSLVRRQLPDDWTERYNTTPVLIETFVETPRFTGALYKASGWTLVGTTKGRDRYDRHTRRDQPKNDIWLRPLRKDWRRTLNR